MDKYLAETLTRNIEKTMKLIQVALDANDTAFALKAATNAEKEIALLRQMLERDSQNINK